MAEPPEDRVCLHSTRPLPFRLSVPALGGNPTSSICTCFANYGPPSWCLLRTVFVVPETHDMVSQLLDPREPKNLSDYLVLGVIAAHIWIAYALPSSWKVPVCGAVFLFWRATYNVGIGYLLTVQSKYRLLVTWAKRLKAFEKPENGNNPRPWLYRLLKTELEAKIPVDYDMDESPIEYNTWLAFRRIVDLILMCDFVSYCLFAIVCGHKPEGEIFLATFARWAVGIILIGINLWVKLDAHRVVKDYAWYWGGKRNNFHPLSDWLHLD